MATLPTFLLATEVVYLPQVKHGDNVYLFVLLWEVDACGATLE